MLARSFAALALTLVAAVVVAQDKPRIERAADLPRFTYKLDGKLEDIVRDDVKFGAFAAQVRRDTQSILDRYEFADKAMQRQLLGVLAQIAWLEGRPDVALATSNRIRELQEKPADKLMSGLQLRAMAEARRAAGNTDSEAYRAEVGRRITSELEAMPYATVENDVKRNKAIAETMGETLVLGRVRNVMQPVADKAGAISSDLAPGIVSARYALLTQLPLKSTYVDTYGAWLAKHRVDKPDIWAGRDVELAAGKGYAPVTVAVWDSGVDTALFPGRIVLEGGKPAVVGFDRYGLPAPTELAPIPEALRGRLPQMKSRIKGASDVQSNVDSAEASEYKRFLSGLRPDQYKAAIEELRLASTFAHGTHVAGIALAGNPYARLVIARIEFGYTLLPDPCPTQELAARQARNYAAVIDYLRAQRVRVVNMSWGGSVNGLVSTLELCGIGKDPAERKTIARGYFDAGRAELAKAIAEAREILFVASAGNANSDSSFAESIPSSLTAPNLITVGAVDKAGDEAAFTSYGPTVAVHANGYQVESTIPGGERVAISGTSMSAPQVTNLAAKILAVNPKLMPPEVIALIRDTAEKTSDGRRTLVHPQKALAAALARTADAAAPGSKPGS